VISAACFVYIAIADLIPDLHRTQGARSASWQVALITTGIATTALPRFLHYSY
jgi:zinc transporter ZupT